MDQLVVVMGLWLYAELCFNPSLSFLFTFLVTIKELFNYFYLSETRLL